MCADRSFYVFVSEVGAPLRITLEETLSSADGSLAHAKGTVVLPVSTQDYWKEAVFRVFPMNNNFIVATVHRLVAATRYVQLLPTASPQFELSQGVTANDSSDKHPLQQGRCT